VAPSFRQETIMTMSIRTLRPSPPALLRAIAVAASSLLMLTAATLGSPDIETYRLTPATFENYQQLTDNMYGYIAEHPELQEEVAEGEEEVDGDSVADLVAALERRAPGLREAMETPDMSLEEYFTFGMVLAASALAVGMEEHLGRSEENQLAPSQRDNISFVRDHYAELESFHIRMQHKYPILFGDRDDDEDEWEEEP
jgi:hypothetical protein